jgi:energy-coupling factor transport system ATP-binding protein
MNNFLEVKNLSFYRNLNDETLSGCILKDISFSVKSGEFVVIFGRNGSGKTTLAKHFNALLKPTLGDVFVCGMNTKDEKTTYEIRKRVGFMFQNPENQIFANTVREDIAFGPENLGLDPRIITENVESALKKTGLCSQKDFEVESLSGGNKQKLAFAGALAMGASCLVLDEPASMLDPVNRKKIMDEIVRLNKEEKISIILLTHYTNDLDFSDRILILENGSLTCEIKKDDIKKFKEKLDVENKIYIEKTKKNSLPLEKALSFKNVSFKTKTKKKLILRDIEVDFFKGEIVGLTGEIGSGKTTFAMLASEIIKPSKGIIEKKTRVIMVFQFPEHQLFGSTVLEEVAFGPKNLGMSNFESDQVARQTLEAIGFPKEKIRVSPFELSGGEQRMAAIAGAFSMKPEIVVLDEPTCGLDLFSKRQILNFIFDYNKKSKSTIILISHLHDDVCMLSDRVFEIKDGTILPFDKKLQSVYI